MLRAGELGELTYAPQRRDAVLFGLCEPLYDRLIGLKVYLPVLYGNRRVALLMLDDVGGGGRVDRTGRVLGNPNMKFVMQIQPDGEHGLRSGPHLKWVKQS